MLKSHPKIPLFSAEDANAGVDLETPLKRVLQSHWYVLGREVAAFEEEFARYIGVDHCVSVASGTDALELALRAVGVQPGDKVITAANAGFYSSTAILAIGAVPVFVDVDAGRMTLSPSALQQALAQHRPKAVIATHLYGRLADMNALLSCTEAAGVPLIEDCAQAHGARRDGRQAGSFGALGCFSFYPTKNLGALGDGGAIVCKNPELSAKLLQLRQYGWSSKYHVAFPGGGNSRLDEMQAAILRAKLPFLDGWNAKRRRIAQRYNEAFADLPIGCPGPIGDDYVAHLYIVRTPRRDALREFLASRGVTTDIHYPVPDHQQAIMSGYSDIALPETERLSQEILTLPCFPGLSESNLAHVIRAVREFFVE